MSEHFGIPDHSPQHAPDHALQNPTPQGSWGQPAADSGWPSTPTPSYGGGGGGGGRSFVAVDPRKSIKVAIFLAMVLAPLVLIDLETREGLTGRSYLFAFAPWTLAPLVGCVNAMAEMLVGDAVAPFEIEAKLRKRLTLLDTPGLVGLALAGVDMCAWDVLAQASSLPLAKLLGGEPKPIRAYNSCGLGIQPVETLADDAEDLATEGGF